MQTASRLTLGRLILIALAAILGLVVSPYPSRANQLTLDDLVNGNTIIVIDNLKFWDFQPGLNDAIGAPIPDLTQITVEPVRVDEHRLGLTFKSNDQWSITTQTFALQATSLSYKVESLDGSPVIRQNSLILIPGEVISGPNIEVNVQEDVFDEYDGLLATKIVFQDVDLNGAVLEQLTDEAEFSPQPFISVSLMIRLQALPTTGQASRQASIQEIQQTFAVGTDSESIISAGPDQVVFDSVILEPFGERVEGTYLWELYRKDGDELVHVATEDGVVAEFKDLERGFYEAKLLLTTLDGETFSDTALVAAAGLCEPEPPETNGHLTVSRLKIKQYKKFNWGYARVSGKVDLPPIRNLGISNGDHLEGIVTIQVLKEGEPVLTLSDDVKLKARDWWRKSVIRKY